jgi:LysR family nitrogen assimilation transcriptional regulator
LDLKQLRCFVHVAELGSFSRAASFLSVGQPLLSRHVRSLETELRQTLFQRNGRGVTLTEAGRRLLEHGRGILQQVERAEHDMHHQRDEATGHVTIGLPPSVSRAITVPLVRAMRERFPRATLTVVEGLSAYITEWLLIGRVDCAVVYNIAPSTAIELIPVHDEQLYFVSRRDPARSRRLLGPSIAVSEVADSELVIPSRPNSMRMLLEAALAIEERTAKVAAEIESIPAILDLVEHDGLHAVLGRNAIDATGRSGAFVLRPIRKLTARLWIATSAQRPKGPLLERSVELLRELLGVPSA